MAPNRKSAQGDATGRKRAQLQKEYEREMGERANEMSMISAERQVNEVEGVFDPSSGELIEGPMQEHAVAQREQAARTLAPGTRQVGDPATAVDAEGILYVDGQETGLQTNDTQVLGIGMETPFQVPGGGVNDERVRSTVDTDNAAIARMGGTAEVVDLGVQDTERETVVVRVNTTVDEMTVGAGNNYSFVEGRQYRVPKTVADRLEELDLIWH